MKKLLSLVLALLCLMAPALAESPDALPVPEGCTLTDGWTGDTTAMHLMDKPDGTTVLACFVRTEDGWALTESTALPEDAAPSLDTFHAGEGGIRVYIWLPEERRAYDDVEDLMVCVDLLADGTWAVTCVNTGWDVIAFYRHSVYDDTGYPFYGDVTLALDITRLDWTALPDSFDQAMSLVDTSRWAIVKRNDAPVQAEDGSILLYALEGAPVTILSREDGMARIALMDSGVTGWIAEDDLLPAAEQMIWSDDLEWWDNCHPTQEYICDNESFTRYTTLHDESTAELHSVPHVENLSLLGRCPQGCCYLVWREEAGEAVWVPAADLPDLEMFLTYYEHTDNP